MNYSFLIVEQDQSLLTNEYIIKENTYRNASSATNVMKQ